MIAIAALVTSIAGLGCLGIGDVFALIFGIVALSRIKKTGERGRGLAIAGIIIGGLVTLLWVAYLLFWLGFFILVSIVGPVHG